LTSVWYWPQASEAEDAGPFVPLASFSTAMEAGMVRQLLVNNGIRVTLQGANFGALEPLPMLGGFSEIQLLVPEAQWESALALYRAFFEESGTPADWEEELEVEQEGADG
jgi:hypothetical protein